MSTFSARRLTAAIALATAVILMPALTGCSTNPLDDVVGTVTDGNVDLGGTTIPADFPSGIPVIDGEVVNSFGVGKGEEKSWTVIVKVADASAMEQIASELEAAGLTSEFEQEVTGISGGSFQSATHKVIVGVTEDGSNGFIATYLVTPATN